ncbi:MAG TPA: arylsulfatase [Agriterribacter sp.]|nr:arylsulfatase [Agriterribacter sp.]
MHRKQTRIENKIISMVNFFLLLFLFFSPPLSAQTKPNIIYILADDLGYGDLTCLNENSKIKTIFIDALAASGTRFTDAHSNSAVCSPTRYGVLTGRYAWRSSLQSGVLWSYDEPLIAKERMTVASLLKTNGYHTACIGKWHLGLGWAKDASGKVDITKPITGGPITNGFDYFYGITASLDIPPYVYIENDKITATSIDTIEATTGKGFWRKGPVDNDFKHIEVLPRMTDRAIEYIRTRSKEKTPFFLYFPLPAPHAPILPTAAFSGKSGTNEYGDFVLMVDDVVGKIMKTVKDAGIENNTLIIFTSDNGASPISDFKELEKYGHHPSYVFRGMKADIFDGGHRIPFIVSWPGKIKPGSVKNETICLTDFMATCASIVNVRLPDNAGEDSYDLMPLLAENSKQVFTRPATVHHSINGSFSIRQGKWKLELCAGSGGWSYPVPKKAEELKLPPIQLYDLETDIAEQKNIAEQHPDVVDKLTALLQQYVDDGRSTPGKREKNDVPVAIRK